MLRMTRRGFVVICTGLMLIGGTGCASGPLSKPNPSAVAQPMQLTEPAAAGPTSMAQDLSSAMERMPRLQAAAPSASGGAETPAPSIPQGNVPPATPGPQTEKELPEITLNQLIQIALQNQPSLRASQSVRDAASARLGTAQAGYFPVIATTLAYTRGTQNVAQGVSAATGNPIQRHVSDRSVNNQTYAISLNQNVFDSFQREWRVEGAREELNASNFDLSTTRQNTILSVEQGYYSYILALHLVEVQQEAVDANIQNLNRVRGFFEVGVRPKFDVTQAQVQLSNAELALVQARIQADTTLAAFKNALGVPEIPPFRLKEELEIPATIGSLEDSIRTALAMRTEIQAAQARIRSAEASLAVARSNFLPTLAANANWNYRGQNLPLAPNWTAGLSVTVPVLNPPLYSQLNEVSANLASAQANEEITRQNVILDVQQNYANLLGARESIRTSEVLVQQARENLELAQGRYQVGVGPQIDVTNAQLSLTQAQNQSIQSIVSFKLAEAGLRKAMGLVE
jgi:outer membrane protein